MRSLILLLSLFSLLQSSAQIGYLDKSFGTNGKTLTSLGTNNVNPMQTSISDDNKILVMARTNSNEADFQIVRYNSKGHLDNNFANGGKLSIVDTSSNSDTRKAYPVGYANMDDGKIVVLMTLNRTQNGRTSTYHKLVRYNQNGLIDQSYGTNGQKEFTLFDSIYHTESFHKTTDEKFIISCHINTKTYKGVIALKFDQNGLIDETFGNKGFRNVYLPIKNNYYEGSYLDAWDNLYLPIFSEYYPENCETSIVKLNSKGEFDNNFGVSGIANITSFVVSAPTLFVDEDKNIFFTGYHDSPSSNFTALLGKIDSTGTPDATFGNNGMADNPLNGQTGIMSTIKLLKTGEPVVAGHNGISGTHVPTLIKYTVNGKVDPKFNFDGYIDINFGQKETSNGNFVEYNTTTGNAIFIGSSSSNLALAAVNCHNGVGIKELAEITTIYPNPANDIFRIECTSKFDNFFILNSLGQVQLEGTGPVVNCSDLSQGSYLLVLSNENQKFYKRINITR